MQGKERKEVHNSGGKTKEVFFRPFQTETFWPGNAQTDKRTATRYLCVTLAVLHKNLLLKRNKSRPQKRLGGGKRREMEEEVWSELDRMSSNLASQAGPGRPTLFYIFYSQILLPPSCNNWRVMQWTAILMSNFECLYMTLLTS